jgi:hypothetical protein
MITEKFFLPGGDDKNGEEESAGKIIHFSIQGYDVVLETRDVVKKTGNEDGDEIKEILRGSINSPRLTVRKNGRELSSKEYGEFRSIAWNTEGDYKLGEKELLKDALGQNTLSMNRIAQIGQIIELMKGALNFKEWQSRYQKATSTIRSSSSWDGDTVSSAYDSLSENDKQKMADEVEAIALEMYHSIQG